MTDYTEITDGQVDASSPVDETLMVSLRDNLIAFIEGDVTAPKAPWVAMEYIATVTGDGSSDFAVFTGFDDTRYSSYLFKFKNVRANDDGRALCAQASDDGGATWLDSGYIASFLHTSSGSPTNLTGLSGMMFTTGIGNSSGEDGFSGDVTVFPPGTSSRLSVNATGSYENSVGAFGALTAASKTNADIDANAMRFFHANVLDPSLSRSEFVSGTIEMYGIRDSKT